MHLLRSWLAGLLFTALSVAGGSSDANGLQLGQSKADAANPRYIVVLKQDKGGLLGQVIAGTLGTSLDPKSQFSLGSLSGFHAQLTPGQLTALQKNPNVAYIEQDGVFKTFGVIKRKSHFSERASLTEDPATWGLERLSQKSIATAPYRYMYDSSAGAGTCIYVIDSGVYTAHNEFAGGRAVFVQNYVYGETGDDWLGHGTAVAAAAAGANYGAAKAAMIYSIKVCNQAGSCDVSAVVSAISNAVMDSRGRSCPNGVILNLSLGGPSTGWQSVKDAVVAATQAGAFVVAAAGNDAANVNNYLPASAAGACSVGASDQNDAIWTYSNRGTSLAVFAPGVGIQTAFIGNPSASAVVDGTSMSAPFVAGLGAYYWAKDGKGSGSAIGVALCTKIKNTANMNALSGNLGGSGNRLAWNGMQ